MTAMRLEVYTDGACEPNPGHGGVGVVLVDADLRQEVERAWSYIGAYVTNNIAEYKALLLGLQRSIEYAPDAVTLFSDSQLVLNQVSGFWKTKRSHLAPLRDSIRETAARLPNVSYRHLSIRESEGIAIADELSRQAVKLGIEGQLTPGKAKRVRGR